MAPQFARIAAAILLGVAAAAGGTTAIHAAPPEHAQHDDGIVQVRSAHGVDETVARLRHAVAAKGIRIFAEIDQSRLATEAGLALRPSTLLIFGNVAIGAQFIAANPRAGLDWPVHVLVYQDAAGAVWVGYTEFSYIAARHRITDRDAAFATAARVIGSIAASVAAD